MIRSMTGYGRAQLEVDNEQLIVEIKSVNYKYRKIYLHMSEKLSGLEPKINQILKDEIGRGRIDYSLRIKSDNDQDLKVQANEKAVKEYIDSLHKLQDKFGLSGEVDINLLTQFSDVLSVKEVEKDIEELWPKVKEVTKSALDNLMKMRSKEGEQLFSDFIHRLERIEQLISKVEVRVPDIVEEYQSKLENRINDLLNNIEIEEDRLASEVAIIADKSNVTEEIVRVESHLEQFRETLNEDIEEPVGRKLDFIAQEMHREINTIGSKISDSEISNHIIDLKSEVDKIREQVQNIE